jgi:SAM-dependent methyltransferase
MNTWSEGYQSEVEYTYGYFSELNPAKTELCCLLAGITPPKVETACELGYGQGVTLNIHAAASGAKWWGTDFNAAHAAFAKELAESACLPSLPSELSFQEFSEQCEEEFDFIGLHGIWSWVSEANRHVIANFIRKKLRPGGIAYVSYNALPGAGSMAPAKFLMTEYANQPQANVAAALGKMGQVLGFVEQLIAAQPAFLRANPEVLSRLSGLKNKDTRYLAHEYLNEHWNPQHFTEVARTLSQAKLEFACSAALIDHLDAINLSAQQRNLLNSISDPHFKILTRDFMVNQGFRRDYWVKGARRLTGAEQCERLRAMRFALMRPDTEIDYKIRGYQQEATLEPGIYEPIVQAFQSSPIRTVSEIEQILSAKNFNLAQVVESLVVLMAKGDIDVLQAEALVNRVTPQCNALNREIIARAKFSSRVEYLSSPLLGGGVPVSRMELLFLDGLLQGGNGAEGWARHAYDVLSRQGEKISKSGKTLENTEDALDEVSRHAHLFAQKKLPILQRLLCVA